MKKKGNFDINYPKLIAYLKQRGLDYAEYNGGQHLKILGPTAAIELWCSRMTYHILKAEENDTTIYYRNKLNPIFNPKELDSLL